MRPVERGGSEEHLSFCRICAAACGIVVATRGREVLEVRGDPDHPVSRGYTCPKGRAIPAFHHRPDRLDVPRLGADPAPWPTVLDDLAARIAAVRAEHGNDAVGAYLATGLAYDVNGWMTAERFLGLLRTKQRYTPATIDNAAILRAAELVTGQMQCSTVWDPEDSRLLVVFGSNPVVSHGYGTALSDPITRIREFRRAGGALWVLDPIRTETAALADGHLAIRPGTDHLVLAWLVRELLAEGADAAELATHTDPADLATLRRVVAPCTLDRVARAADVPAAGLRDLLDAIRRAGRIAAFVGTGVVMHPHGLVAAWLRWVLLAITGSFDRPGGMRVNPGTCFPFRGRVPRPSPPEGWTQPGPPSRPDLPRWAGQYPCAAMVDEIEAGNLRALVILGGNPLVAFPDPDRTAAALASLDVLAVADVVDHELVGLATHVLPATAQMERADLPMVEGISLTTGTQYTDAVVPPAAERRPVWWILGELGRRLDLDVLDGLDPDATDGRALLVRLADRAGADGAAVVAAGPRGLPGPPPEFGWVHDEVLPDGRFRLAPAALVERLDAELASLDAARPATVLVPRRQLRSMNSARYESAARPEDPPWVRIGADDAAAGGLADGDPVDLVGAHGRVRGVVRIDPRLRPGVVSLTHGWIATNVSRLTSVTDAVDPLTGMVCQSAIPVELRPA
ncbi:MAG: molybdopterin oxidoreductase [Actinobacteria bacterium]|nr:molybdopterin oxidoreductase [Actinomycetota bacterium]